MDPRKRSIGVPASLALLALLAPGVAMAHVGVGQGAGFLAGFAHPLGGVDHVGALLTVGLWAAQLGGRALFVTPLSFVAAMALGAALGAAGIRAPLVESGIVLSVFVLGALVAASVRLPTLASCLLVGLFALFHGHAHGAEMPASAALLAYGAGFALATAALHAVGIGIALSIAALGHARVVRWSGAAISFCGVYLWLASS